MSEMPPIHVRRMIKKYAITPLKKVVIQNETDAIQLHMSCFQSYLYLCITVKVNRLLAMNEQ